ncbi:MAG: hypothetical protein JW888_12645, partial [Pirellulales bacterium]|nr:hypothetical protein [Pirellulales bacterium]
VASRPQAAARRVAFSHHRLTNSRGADLSQSLTAERLTPLSIPKRLARARRLHRVGVRRVLSFPPNGGLSAAPGRFEFQEMQLRRTAGLLLGLVLLGWILTEVPVAQTEPTSTASDWKRTRDGWEHQTWDLPDASTPSARLHPAVVGAFELLASLVALLALPVAPRQSALSQAERSPQPSRAASGSGPFGPRRSSGRRLSARRRVGSQ